MRVMLCEVPIRKSEISGKIVATKEPTSPEKLIEQNRFFFKMSRQCRCFPLSIFLGMEALGLVFPALVFLLLEASFSKRCFGIQSDTLPEKTITPENRPSWKEISSSNHWDSSRFLICCYCRFREGVWATKKKTALLFHWILVVK